MAISATQVKELRDRTGLGFMDCKAALQEAQGNADKAIEILRKKGLTAAEQRRARTTTEGRIGQYVHFNHKLGVLVELRCETDFVARNADFASLLKDLCLQVAAKRPLALDREGLPKDAVEREREIYVAQVKDKPPAIQEKIVEGKMGAFYKEACLLEQAFVKDDTITVKDRIDGVIAKLGENISVGRFARMELGQEA